MHICVYVCTCVFLKFECRILCGPSCERKYRVGIPALICYTWSSLSWWPDDCPDVLITAVSTLCSLLSSVFFYAPAGLHKAPVEVLVSMYILSCASVTLRLQSLWVLLPHLKKLLLLSLWVKVASVCGFPWFSSLPKGSLFTPLQRILYIILCWLAYYSLAYCFEY